MANKIVKIPVSKIDGLRSDGSYLLRYRVKSKDGILFSEWSEPYRLYFPTNGSNQVSSFYEVYLQTGRPLLETSSIAPTDPHPSSPYDLTVVTALMDSTKYISSEISASTEAPGSYTYKWKIPNTPTRQSFDVYLSWKDSFGVWQNWSYIGTTSSDSISFNKPDDTYQAVQAAVFLSGTNKLTNIFNNQGEVTFISISKEYSTYYSATGTLGTVSGTAPYASTITGLTGVPTGNSITGRRIFATGTRFGTGAVTVASTTATSITVHSTAALTAGAITNIKL